MPTPDTLDPPFGHHRPGPLVRALIGMARGVPAIPGRVHLAHLARSIAIRGARMPMDVACGRIRLRSDPRDNHCEKTFVFTPWRYDVIERRLLLEALPPGGIFLDIGANVGLYTLLAAEHLGPQGRVLAFEPNPRTHARLRANLAATMATGGDWPTIDAMAIGVADAAGEFELYLEAGALGNSSLLAGAVAGAAETVRIPCLPLLDILASAGIESVDAIKIDIEGAEDRALVPFLEAASESLLPRVIVLEQSDADWQLDLPGTLAARGYEIVHRARLNTVYRRQPDPG